MNLKNAYDDIIKIKGFSNEVERLRYQAEISWHKDIDYFNRIGINEGMKILEVGSGPGFITECIIKSFPSVSITCL